MRKSKKLLKRIIEHLEQIPIVTVACQKEGISRQTFYRWYREDGQFQEEVDRALTIGRESINDLCESKLIEAIKAGERWGITLFLTNNKSNYMKPRLPVKPSRRIPEVNIEFVDFSGGRKKGKDIEIVENTITPVDGSDPTDIGDLNSDCTDSEAL